MGLHLRKSRVLRQMRNGMVATCTKINFSDVRCVEISAMSGVDCVWVDMEHIPNDYSFIENAARAAKLYDCDLLTRVPNGSYSDIIRPLEGDSTGVMVPHVMSLENAKRVAYYTKFHPIGRRPLDGGNADGVLRRPVFLHGLVGQQSRVFVRFGCVHHGFHLGRNA